MPERRDSFPCWVPLGAPGGPQAVGGGLSAWGATFIPWPPKAPAGFRVLTARSQGDSRGTGSVLSRNVAPLSRAQSLTSTSRHPEKDPQEWRGTAIWGRCFLALPQEQAAQGSCLTCTPGGGGGCATQRHDIALIAKQYEPSQRQMIA